MRATRILRSILGERLLETIHSVRRSAVFFAVGALMRGGRLSLTGIGRAAVSRVSPKHNVKRVDRLLGNRHLHGERAIFGRALASRLFGNGEAVVLIDWTKLQNGFWALVAAVGVAGRAVALYSEVHSEKELGNPTVEEAFLDGLANALPKGVQAILITDAGFRNPWFAAVRRRGWHYLGRLQGNVLLESEQAWQRVDRLVSGKRHRDLGVVPVAKTLKRRAEHRVVLAKATKPKRQKRGHYLERPNQQSRQKARQRASANCVLASSMTSKTANELVCLYRKRMEIEEMFRDIKNSRYGWALEFARTRSAQRYEILLLLAALATFALLLFGLAAEKQGIHRRYQANTTSARRVLSCLVLARAMLARGDTELLTLQQCRNAIADIYRGA